MPLIPSQKVKNILIIIAIALILSGLYYLIFHRISKQRKFLNQQIEILEKQEKHLLSENIELKKGIKNNNELENMDREARINFGYKKAGENTVILETTSTTIFSKNPTKNTFNIFDIIKS